MNTVDFIRHHTRLILEKDEKTTPPSAPSKGDFKGKYSKSVRVGRISNEAKAALGLAARNPNELLANLGLSKYTTVGNNKLDEIFNFIEAVRRSSTLMGVAFEKPVKQSKGIDIPVFLLGNKVPAIKQTQAPRYVKALLLAAHTLGIVDFDIERNSVGLRSVDEGGDGEGEEKQFFVRVSYRA
jgi:hypothetical protein